MGFSRGPKIVTDGLVLTLDAANTKSYPGSGTSIYDLSGNGNTGTLTNGAAYSTERGGCITLDGSNDHIYASSISNFSSGYSTMLVWVYVDSTSNSNTYTGIINYGTRSTNTPSTANLLSILSSGTTWTVTSAYWGNDWTSSGLAIVKDGWNFIGKIARNITTTNNVTLISGANSATGTTSGYTKGLNIPSAALTVGCTDLNGGRPLKGKIASAMVFDRELSTTEWTQIYNATKGRFGL